MRQFVLFIWVYFGLVGVFGAPHVEKLADSTNRYRYDGAQLWKVNITSELSKEFILNLQEIFGT